MTNKTKTFKESIEPTSPVLQFISATPEKIEKQEVVAEDEVPSGFKKNPLYVETKSRRLQLLVQPSLFYCIKEKAALKEMSINEYVHSVLSEATKVNE